MVLVVFTIVGLNCMATRSSRNKTNALNGDIAIRVGKVLRALNNAKYEKRTFKGISKEVGLSRDEIIRLIKTDPGLRSKLKVYRRKTVSGEYLVTTKDRFYKTASFKDKFVDIFSTKEATIDDI